MCTQNQSCPRTMICNMVQMSSNGTLFILLENQITTQMEREQWFFIRYLSSLLSSCKFDNFKDKTVLVKDFQARESFSLGFRGKSTTTYSRVPHITVGLNKSVGTNFSWKLIKM